MNPIVSVLVTVFNREAYLAETLDSILNSTFQNFEIIVVDDCSTDNSLKIARQFALKDGRIAVHVNERNLGDYNNRNRAASLASGRYIKYLDADDLIYRNSLDGMVDALDRFSDAALALSSNVIDPPEPYPVFFTPKKLIRQHFMEQSPLGVGPSAAIIRRDCFEKVGGFSGTQFVGDSELWLKLAEQWPVVTLPPALIWWRQHEGQQMHLELSKPEVLTTRYVLEKDILDTTRHLTEDQKVEAREYLTHLHARRIWSFAIKTRQPSYLWALYRASGMSLSKFFTGLKRPVKH